MKEREELELILNLIRKYNLPLSPILEYAIKEKMEEYPVEQQIAVIDNDKKAEDNAVVNGEIVSNDLPIESISGELRIVDYGERTIAVVGDTKPHKDKLKSLGMKWHYKKRMWYLSPEGYRRFGKKSYSIDEIRQMYGSKKYKNKDGERLAIQA